MATTASAEMTVKEFRQLKSGSDEQVIQAFLQGAGVGIGWANSMLEDRKQMPLYCPPETLALQGDNFIDILNKQVEADKTFLNIPLGAVLLIGLMNTFPCK